MSGYWNDPVGTAETLVDGWLRTGDLATRDDKGIFRLRGRVKMFIRGGYNVYPMEVEGVLLDHPDVAEIALVPRPDPVMGEIGVAVIVPVDPSAPPTLDDLQVHGEATLAHHKLPEAIRVVAELPNASDKIDRRALARVEAEHPSTNVADARHPYRRPAALPFPEIVEFVDEFESRTRIAGRSPVSIAACTAHPGSITRCAQSRTGSARRVRRGLRRRDRQGVFGLPESERPDSGRIEDQAGVTGRRINSRAVVV